MVKIKMTTKERIFYYDLLRAFAIIAVIICHVDHFFGPLTTQTQIIAQMTFHDIGDIRQDTVRFAGILDVGRFKVSIIVEGHFVFFRLKGCLRLNLAHFFRAGGDIL